MSNVDQVPESPAPRDAQPVAAPDLAPSPAPRPSALAVLREPLVVVSVVVALFLGIGGTLAVQGIGSAVARVIVAAKPELTGKKFFAAALLKCNVSPSSNGISVGDDGNSLSLDNKGDDDFEGVSIEDEACILKAVGTPDSTIDKMDATRALDGRQSDSWKHVSGSWSYHPDNGLDVILQFRK